MSNFISNFQNIIFIIFLFLISNSLCCIAQGYKQKVFDMVPGVYRLDLNPYDDYLTFYEKKDLINKLHKDNLFGVLRLKQIVNYTRLTFEILYFTYFVEIDDFYNIKFYVHEINETKKGPPFSTKVYRNITSVKSVDIQWNLESYKFTEIDKIVKLMYEKEKKDIKKIEVIGLSEYVFFWRIIVIKATLKDDSFELMATIDRVKEEIKDNNSDEEDEKKEKKEKKYKKRGLRIDKCFDGILI
jgi:hypothetical protein